MNQTESVTLLLGAKGQPLASIDRSALDPSRNLFKEGNQAAAKEKWSARRLEKWAADLQTFRTLIGFNYTEMGAALGNISGQYIKMLETGQRQPSSTIVRLFRRLKAHPAFLIDQDTPASALERVAEIWSHVLGHRFKCAECARELKAAGKPKALAYWFGGRPNQRHCPKHSPRRKAHRSARGKA